MAKITLKNVTTATLRSTKPGQTFSVDGTADGPTDIYWRRRLADGSVELVSAASPATPAEPVSRPAAKKQKD